MKDLLKKSREVEARLRVAARVTHWNGLELEAAATIAALCTELEAVQWNYSAISSALTDAVQDKDLLREQLKAAQADAARYQQLKRTRHHQFLEMCRLANMSHAHGGLSLDESLDAAITAQSAQEKPLRQPFGGILDPNYSGVSAKDEGLKP